MSLLSTPFDPAREAALVTGAGNGIGRAIAQALVGEGVRTMFADVQAETGTAAASTLPRPELAVTWVGDLGSRVGCDGGQIDQLQRMLKIPRLCRALRRRGARPIMP